MHINSVYLLIQVGRDKAESVIVRSQQHFHQSFMDNHGGLFDEELASLANGESPKKDKNINGTNPEVLNTEQQQKLIAETYAEEDKEVPYKEQYQSNGRQMENAIVAVKSKEVEKEHHFEEVSDDSLDITFSDFTDSCSDLSDSESGDDRCTLESLQDSFVEMGTKEI